MSEDSLPRVVAAGDAALLVVFAEEISLAVNARVHALAAAIEREGGRGVRAVVPAYASLLVQYDPLALSFAEMRSLALELAKATSTPATREEPAREIPTVYGGAYGPDLPAVAKHRGLTEDEVIQRHSGATYVVYMLGFTPGFPYLGGLPAELVMPRLPSPRQAVPAGSVAIANQSAIYSLTSPGGWHVIGRTAIKMFDPSKDPPAYLQAGDRVRFVPLSEEQYLAMGGAKAG